MLRTGAQLVGLGLLALAATAQATTSIEWEISPDVPSDRRALLEDALPRIAAAAEERFGASSERVRVVAAADYLVVARAYAQQENITGDVERFVRTWEGRSRFLAAGESIFYVVNDEAPKSDALLRALAHEYFHVLQHAASGPLQSVSTRDDLGAAGPLWLVEGSAEYAQRLLTSDAGLYCDDLDRDRIYREAARSDAGLGDLETKTQNDLEDGAGYTVGAVAVEVLARERGDAAILDYFSGLRGARDWNASFEDAFGMPPAIFHAAFETARKGFAPTGTRLPMDCVKYVVRSIPEPGISLVGAAVSIAVVLACRR
jgi:hypothetical protein